MRVVRRKLLVSPVVSIEPTRPLKKGTPPTAETFLPLFDEEDHPAISPENRQPSADPAMPRSRAVGSSSSRRNTRAPTLSPPGRYDECTTQRLPPAKVRSRVRGAEGSSESDGGVVLRRARKRRVMNELSDEENLEADNASTLSPSRLCDECTAPRLPPVTVRSRVRGPRSSEGVVVRRARKRRVMNDLSDEDLEGNGTELVGPRHSRRGTREGRVPVRDSTGGCSALTKRTEADIGSSRARSGTDTDEDSDAATPKVTNRARNKRILCFKEEEDEEDDGGYRRLVSEEDQGLKEDLEDLDQSKVVLTRTRERGKKSDYEKALEKLKDRKIHRPETATEQSLPDDDDESGESDGPEESGGHDVLDDEGFVVESNDDDGYVDLPAEFSLNILDVAHSFETLIHCYVYGVLDPTFLDQVYDSDSDAYTRAALEAVERRIQMYEHNLVASQAWRPDFKRDMNICPQYGEYEIVAEDGCEACGKSNRTATVCVVLSGKPYNKKNFKAIEDDCSDFSEEAHLYEYRIGRFCHARSKLYHELHHMRYHLYEWVQAEVGAVVCKLGEIEGKDMIEEMERSGFIKTLFSQFENLIESAEKGYATLS